MNPATDIKTMFETFKEIILVERETVRLNNWGNDLDTCAWHDEIEKLEEYKKELLDKVERIYKNYCDE